MWKKLLRGFGIGETMELGERRLKIAQQALTHASDLQAIIADQTAMIRRYEIINSDLLAALSPSDPTPSASGSGRGVSALSPNHNGIVILRKS